MSSLVIPLFQVKITKITTYVYLRVDAVIAIAERKTCLNIYCVVDKRTQVLDRYVVSTFYCKELIDGTKDLLLNGDQKTLLS